MDSEIIRFEDVSKSYQGFEVLEKMNFGVERGELLTIIGHSGCGKTTLLKLINRLLKPDNGIVRVEGQNVEESDLIALRRSIGYVVQGIGLFPHMDVARNIGYVPSLHRTDKDALEARVITLMKLVGLDLSFLHRYPDELSGGQRQRVGIARALANKPNILLMDEPFGSVDGITRRQLQEELLGIHRRMGLTVLLVTHDIREALLGTRVLVMEAGKVVQMDCPERLSAAPATDYVAALLGKSLPM